MTRSPSATIPPWLVFQRRRHALDEVEEALAAARDVRAVLDVGGRPVALSRDVVSLVEQGVEGLEDKRFVFRFTARTGGCRRPTKARVPAGVIIERRIMQLGT